MFSIQIDGQSSLLNRLLKSYHINYDHKIIDFTYGKGALWADCKDYNVVKTDKVPMYDDCKEMDLLVSDYNTLGKFDVGVFDPPYLIGRMSFNYVSKKSKEGDRCFSERHVANKNRQEFDDRVVALNKVAHECLTDKGLLIVKVMDCRDKGKLIDHHIRTANLLTNFSLDNVCIYARQGSTTFKPKRGLQGLHGYWMIFERI